MEPTLDMVPTTAAVREQALSVRNDAALDAVILGKPVNDQIPTAVWWFLAESLELSVILRRAAHGTAPLSRDHLLVVARRARLAAEAALDELDEEPPGDGVEGMSLGLQALQASVRDLARMIVNHRPVSRAALCAAIHTHLACLAIT